MILVATLAFIHTAIAQQYTAHTDVEFRLGGGVLCGTCQENDEGLSRTIKMTAQIFADRLFPVTTIGDGVFEIGPYVKGALLDGVNVPLIAGGAIVGYRIGTYEILVNGGFGYATERIGETTSDGVVHPGQTKHTYDLGVTLRYDINQYFISAGYQHNSNGTGFNIEYAHAKGSNPGYDNVFAGVGIRF
jgi:bacterioferritin-associated ferredoxin